MNPFQQFEEIRKSSEELQNYNFLLLTIYFYLKHNQFNLTADTLFNESNLANIFKFPQEVSDTNNEKDKILKKFLKSFYYNNFFANSQNFDLLSDFWEIFWKNFSYIIKTGNKAVSIIDKFLINENKKLSYKENKTYH